MKDEISPVMVNIFNARSVQKILGLFELRGSSWFHDNPLGVTRFVQIG